MRRQLSLLVAVLAFAAVKAQLVEEPYECADLDDNPWGACDCQDQVFIGPDCTQSFTCYDPADVSIAAGCLRDCPPGFSLVPDFGTDGTQVEWECIEAAFTTCPGFVQIYCEGTPEAIPDMGITDETRCQCDGEIFISPDCKHADTCQLVGEGQYVLRNAADCTGDDHIVMDFLTWEYECRPNIDNCPGNGGFSLGCTVGSPFVPYNPECTYTTKPDTIVSDVQCNLSNAACDNQMFINDDCTQGFVCMSQLPDGESGEGCLVECEEGYKIFAEFDSESSQPVQFLCVSESVLPGCPGEFYVNCADEPIDPETDDCACEGELLVSPDCNIANYCQARGGELVKQGTDCDTGEIIQIDGQAWDISCQPEENDRCPGGGGFRWGCGVGTPERCIEGFDTQDNFGTCGDCNGKLFISADCSEGLQCDNEIPNPDLYDGCAKSCGNDQVLIQDLNNEEGWICASISTVTCFGAAYETPCPDESLNYDAGPTDCIGANDVIVTRDCTSGYSCAGGLQLSCPNEIIRITNFPVENEDDYLCLSPTLVTCPAGGGYKYGDFSDPRPTTSTTTETTTTLDGITPGACTRETLDFGEGTCECEMQVFMNQDCTKAFLCDDGLSNDGCLYECPEFYKLVPDFGADGSVITWLCVEEIGHVCPGEFKIHCDGADDAIPVGGIGNDDSRCDCDGQVFVDPLCQHVDRCSAIGSDTYVVRPGDDCEDGQTVKFNFATWTYTCADDVDNCPGNGGFSLGCQDGSPNIPIDPNCTYTTKDFTTEIPCGSCDHQVFINEDCTRGFECQTDSLPTDAPAGAEGCLVECPSGQSLYPEFFNGGQVTWHCVDDTLASCPGAFNINCADDPIDPTNDDCECAGELFVSPDCTTGDLCVQIGTDSYVKQERSCGAGEILDIDFDQWTATCQDDNGNCPLGGGFKWGCGDGSPAKPFLCGPDGPAPDNTNGIGTCDCDGTVFINSDCSYGFYCNSGVANSQFNDGCAQTCPNGEILVQDLTSDSQFGFSCISSGQAECVGGTYTSFCDSGYDLSAPADANDCSTQCDGEIFVRNGCTDAFRCDSTIQGGGNRITCSGGQVLTVINREINDWAICVDPIDEGIVCPASGGYQYDCFTPQNDVTTTEEDDTPPTTNGNGATDDTGTTDDNGATGDTGATDDTGATGDNTTPNVDGTPIFNSANSSSSSFAFFMLFVFALGILS